MAAHSDQTLWEPEWETFADPKTGAKTIQLTNNSGINHPLYYLANSFSLDCKTLVFASDRAGKMDLYRVSLDSGGIRRLTNLEDVQPFSPGQIYSHGVCRRFNRAI